ERERRRLGRKQAQRGAEALRLLLSELPLHTRRQRSGAEPEEPLRFSVEPLREPRRRLLHPAVVGQAPSQLLGGLLRLELRELQRFLRKEAASLQLQESRDQDEELPTCVKVQTAALLQSLAESEHDHRDIDLRELELLAKHQRQQQVERSLEGVEIQLELAHDHEWLSQCHCRVA